jgi:hypothetical protein
LGGISHEAAGDDLSRHTPNVGYLRLAYYKIASLSTSHLMSSDKEGLVAPSQNQDIHDETGLHFVPYGDQKQSEYLPAIRQLISKDLSEPYSIYVYRYFLYQWGDLCFMV